MSIKSIIYCKIITVIFLLNLCLFFSLSCTAQKRYNITNNKEIKFEPSGFTKVSTEKNDTFLLVNDKELNYGLYAYTYNIKSRLLIPKKVRFNQALYISETVLSKIKWEGITGNNYDIYLLSNTGDIFRTKSDDQEKFLLTFCPEPSNAIKRISAYIKTEGIAVTPDNKSLLVGLRCRDSETNYVAEVYKIDLTKEKPTAELVLRIKDLFDHEGISSIEYDNYHNLFLFLTSVELEGDSKDSVAGYLWISSPDFKNAFRILRFDHKPEGIAASSNGDIIIVFDDDANRKDSFGLKQNESLCQVFPEKIFSDRIKGIKL